MVVMLAKHISLESLNICTCLLIMNFQNNTFQCVLVTDGAGNSFVIFLYPEDGIQWITATGSPYFGMYYAHVCSNTIIMITFYRFI